MYPHPFPFPINFAVMLGFANIEADSRRPVVSRGVPGKVAQGG